MALKTRCSGIVLSLVLFVILYSTAAVSAQSYRPRQNSLRPAASSTLNYRKSLAGDEREVYELVNRERARRGLGPLRWFDHFDEEGKSVTERAEDSNITDWSVIGENLFFCEGYDRFDRLAVRGWMDSPTHRDNILDRRYNATGIGVAQSGNGEIYITQIFVERR